MAEFKAPYKNNTASGIAKNANAYANYVTNEVGQRGDKKLDQAADALVAADNRIRDNANLIYNDAKAGINATKQFFTGDAVSSTKGKSFQSMMGTPQNTTSTTQSTADATYSSNQGKRLPVRPATPPEETVETEVVETPTQSSPNQTNTTARATGGNNAGNQRQLKNADINFSQYGDDSSAPNQATAGGQNEKYTGEFTKNSNLGYDPNVTTADLDPNYLFGMDAQWANTDSAGYIARRNDMIASALYNEGRTSKEDVVSFLASQPGWNNSTEADRFNTVESIWKRLGGIEQENQINTPEQPNLNNEQPTYSDEALNNMEADLNRSTAGELYGKVTADSNTSIKTLEDENSVYKSMNEARINTYKQLRGMDSQAIAAAVVSGAMAMDSQAMRDLMQYDSAKYEYVQQAIKQLRGQMNINSITSGSGEWSTSATNGASSLANEKADFATGNANSGTSTAEILKNVNQTLNSNNSASTAQEQMGAIENDMYRLQNRLSNLKKEANQVFKGDVPQYIVNAYISNRTAEIQNELGILENRYNAAYSRYQNEWEQTKRAAEFDLKKQEFQLKKDAANLDDWATKQGIALKWADLNGTTNGTTLLSTLSAQEALNTLSDFSNSYATGSHGGQCGAFVKKYLASIGVNLPNMSSIDSKKSIIDSSITEASDGDIVIMTSTNYPENGHMAIVESVDDDGTLHLLESNWGGDEQVHRRTVKPTDKSILGYYRPTGGTANTMAAGGTPDTLTRHETTYNLTDYPAWNELSDAAKETVKGLLTYQIAPDDLPKTGENGVYKTQVLNAASEIGRKQGWTSKRATQIDAYVKGWNKALNQGGVGSANSTAASLLWELSEQFKEFNAFDVQTANSIINRMAQELGGSDVMATYADLNVAANEVAKALKGNASATEQEKKDIQALLTGKMSNAQAQKVFQHFAKDLVDKNASEAQQYKRVVGYKPESIYLEEVTDWMNNELGVDMARYYDYQPNGGWNVFNSDYNNTSKGQYTATDILSI